MTEYRKKTVWRRMLKGLLVTVLTVIVVLLAGIGIVLNFIFTPAKLTPLVEQKANEYLNAEVQVEEIELTFFSTFPDFGLKITNASVVSKVLQDSVSGVSKTDSLLYMERGIITIDPVAYLLHKQIKVKDFVLERPQIYAYVNAAGEPNWNIVKAEATEEELPQDTVFADTLPEDLYLDIKNMRIRDGRLVVDDRNTMLYARLDGLNLGIDGNFLGRTAELQLDLNMKNVLFWQEGQLVVKKLALGITTGMSINRDSLLYRLNRTVFDVNGVKFGGAGILQADTVNRTVKVDIKYGIHIPSLKTLLDFVPDTLLRRDMEVDVKGDVVCKGSIQGVYGKQRVPLITSYFKIDGGYISYKGMPSKVESLDAEAEACIDLQKEQTSTLKLKHFCLKGGKTDIDLEGVVSDLLKDPLIKAKMEARIDFDDITKIFPLADGITCRGYMDASLKGNVLWSDVVAADYGKLKVGGKCKMQEIALFVPQDSIRVGIKTAGLAFGANRKNEKVVQGKDLLSGIVGYSGLNVQIQNRIKLLMDTTYLTLRTTPLRDTSAVATVSSSLHLGRTVLIVRDTLLLGLKQAAIQAKLMPSPRNKRVPRIESHMKVDSLRLRSLGNRLALAKADIKLNAVRSRRDEKIWIPSGYVDFVGLRAYTPYFPLRLRMPGTRIHFNRKEILLDSARLQLGRSDVRLTGKITNLSRAFFRHETLYADLELTSKMLNCNQLMRALDAGTAYMNLAVAERKDTVSSIEDDMEQMEVLSDTAAYEGSSSVFVVPKGIDLAFRMKVDHLIFGKLLVDSIRGEVNLRDQRVELADLQMRSSAADMDATAIYRATDTLRAYTGFALKMHDIRIDSLVRVIPALDTLFPMLRSFEGVVDFHISAKSWLDSTFMIELPTLRAAAYLDGHDLVLMDGETFAEISKMLMFKNKKRNLIDSISVDLLVKNGVVEIFPFLLEMDRYKVAIGGEHNIDMSFNYHISLLKSPIPFRAGIDIFGNLDKMKFRITKAKYKDIFIPSRRAKVDSAQLNLRKQIRTLLRDGGRNELDSL